MLGHDQRVVPEEDGEVGVTTLAVKVVGEVEVVPRVTEAEGRTLLERAVDRDLPIKAVWALGAVRQSGSQVIRPRTCRTLRSAVRWGGRGGGGRRGAASG